MYRLLTIGFPFYLIIFEKVFRDYSNIDSSSFVGPAIAASGLGLLIRSNKTQKD